MMIKNQFYNKSKCLITKGTLDFIFRPISLRKLVQRYESHKIYQDQKFYENTNVAKTGSQWIISLD